jgi:predicted enzyme related to lactoylglutathione lyase
MPAKKAKKKVTKRKATGKKAVRAARAHRPKREQPESLRLRSMSASLTVNDLAKSIAFYRDVARFTPGDRWEENGQLRGIEMKAGICDLWLNQDDFARGRDRKKGEGVRLWASTAQDIAEMAARIKAMGGDLDYEPRRSPWGEFTFALVDPDGYKITILQEE